MGRHSSFKNSGIDELFDDSRNQVTRDGTVASSPGYIGNDAQSLSSNEQDSPEKKKRKKGGGWLSCFFGVLGELLITVGVVIGLFIVWQIWWTNVEATASINSEVDKIHSQFGDVPQKIGQPQTGEPPIISPNKTEGATLAVIHIPAFGYDHATPIKEGVSNKVLNTGAFGHYPTTALPGEVGNFSTAVHREIYGARMLHVDTLEEGTPIVVETPDAWLVFKMVNHELVDPADTYVIAPDPFVAGEAVRTGKEIPNIKPTRRLLTITTCHPPMVSNQRWIVHAEFDHWVKRSDGMPQELIDPDQ
ncbi:class E sortase [Arcanobacterium ihumii]|uniref:class E sortase n=1 Tax=Arcanobacterium ihumii TaxID=2138162 RepID=UPI001F1BE8F0|nr:class E sortase [Arcanobacterium ihumii]